MELPNTKKEASQLIEKYRNTDTWINNLIAITNTENCRSIFKNLSAEEKEIFMESLVLDTENAENLSTSELRQYLELAEERANLCQIKENQARLQNLLDENLESQDGKMLYTLIESIDKYFRLRERSIQRIHGLSCEIKNKKD